MVEQSLFNGPKQLITNSSIFILFIGVNQCNTYLFSHQPYQGNITLSASSERSHFDKTNDYSANRGRLHSTETMGFGVQLHGGWSAAFKDSNQYIKVSTVVLPLFVVIRKSVKIPNP